jgi:hypothetical protein
MTPQPPQGASAASAHGAPQEQPRCDAQYAFRRPSGMIDGCQCVHEADHEPPHECEHGNDWGYPDPQERIAALEADLKALRTKNVELVAEIDQHFAHWAHPEVFQIVKDDAEKLAVEAKALRTENETLSAKAALLSRYCGWIRWRRTHGAFGGGEQELLDAFDAIDAGQTFEYPDHWVRDALTPPIDGEGAAGVMSETWKFEPWGVPELGLVKLWDENGKEVGVIASAQQASRIIAAHNGGLVQALRDDAFVERAAAAVHQAYLDTCDRLGWGVKPENRVPYEELPEDAKELDRASVRAALTALEQT